MSDAVITLGGVVVGALLAGAGSAAVTVMTARTTAKRDKLRFEHEAAMAAEARRQCRIEGTYLHLLHQLRQDARLAANELRAQVAAELRGEDGGSSDPANGSVS